MKRVVVMGLGRFGGGASVARWFAARGDSVLVTDLAAPERLANAVAEIEPLGVRFRLGGHEAEDFDEADLVVVNPAVPFDAPMIARARARGIPVATELGLTLNELSGPVLAVTGTNGKSTTAALAAAMLEDSGVPVILGGNIGRSLLNEAAGLDADTVAVLEISSFQLQWLEHDGLRPHVGIVTNVTGDHFDRHGTFEHYVEAKRRLVAAVPPEGLLLLRAGDPVCAGFARVARARIEWFGPGCEPAVDLSQLTLAGTHNRDNAAAAARAALELGATRAGCRAAAARFGPLPHRLERVAETRDGVLLVDDSVSTTPEAAAAAVRAFDRPVILLTGGRDKGLKLKPLLNAAARAQAVVAYGETGPRIHNSLKGAHLRGDFDSAVRLALDLARPGDVVLLSPGFASYDEFPGFDARGARFRELVSAYPFKDGDHAR